MSKFISIIKKLLPYQRKKTKKGFRPVILRREQHHLSRKFIGHSALKVLYRLHKSGYSAYLVGGSVRDLLLNHHPKDFDIATNAHPEQIQRLFRNSFIIGRRFRLVHVVFGKEVIEVATFRSEGGSVSGRVQTKHGLLLRDNVYGTLEDDVWRRDFTVNALYYNIADFTVVDYTQGIEDLKKRSIRVIGNPEERYREDPARMLRAVRLAAKLNFTIESQSFLAIKQHKELITQIPPARLLDKMYKVFHGGKSAAVFNMFIELDILRILFPVLATSQTVANSNDQIFIFNALENTDQRVASGKKVNSAFIFAVLLWCPVQQLKEKLKNERQGEYHALSEAMSDVIHDQVEVIAIPKRTTSVMREIWYLQYHLEHARAKRIYKIFHHERFRAAYDFLGLRTKVDTSLEKIYQWWTDFQKGDEESRNKLILERFARKNSPKKSKKN